MVKVKNVSFAYSNGKTVIYDINFNIGKGESVGIIGANGAGKSTILKLLIGLELGFTGEIFINDIQVTKKNLN